MEHTKYPFPLTEEGMRFKGSRHEDNLAQFMMCYTKDHGSETANRTAFMLNCRRWALLPWFTQNWASAAWEVFKNIGVANPDMVGATFYKLGEGEELAGKNPIDLPDIPLKTENNVI